MRCTDYWVHHGPSIYSNRPVIRYTLDVAPLGSFARSLETIRDRLFLLLPGLREHASCDVGGILQGGSGQAARTAIPHLFEHVSLELQNRTGAELGCVRAPDASVAADVAAVPYEDERVALEAGAISLELINTLLTSGVPVDFERRLQTFFAFAERQRLPVQDQAVVRAAEARDIPVIRIAGRLVQFGHGCHLQRMNGTESTHTTIVSNDLASNKDYARRVFQAVGLPVPRYERVYRKEDAVAAAKRIGFPVVMKPNGANMGEGVSVGLRTDREVRDAFERTRSFGRSVLVEEYVPGADYRMLVINGKLEAAAKRVPAHVVGDGAHTIEELVGLANQDPRRGAGHRASWTRLELDDQSKGLLAERGYERATVVPDGEIVYLKRIANTSAGGTAVDVTEQVHPENREIAERAARAIGLDVAGVDLLVRDIAEPLRAQGGVICEINSRPGVRKHLWPAVGQPRDVIGPILDMLFPPGTPSRIPIAVVTGVGDTSDAARMLANLLSAEGSTVGLATRDGVFIDGKRADGGGMNSAAAARMLLLDPAVQLAVLDVPPAEVVRYGLGYDWADALAVVNDKAIPSSDLLDGLRLAVGSARAHVVMTAKDEAKYGLKPHADARVWHLKPDGRAAANGYLFARALALCLGRQPDDIERKVAGLPLDLVQER